MLKNLTSKVLVLCMALSTLAISAAPSRAENMMWTFDSYVDDEIHISLYSQTKKGYEWPGGDEVYFIDPYDKGDIEISCDYGEKICYGAWRKGRHNGTYWGTGYKARQGCEHCCATCGISDDPSFNLQE